MYQANPAWIECQKISEEVDELYNEIKHEKDKDRCRKVLYPIFQEKINKLNLIIPAAYKIPLNGNFTIFFIMIESFI